MSFATAGCAGAASSRPVAVPPAHPELAGTGHDHDCVAAAESAWAIRERNLERAAGNQNALALPGEGEKPPAADLEPFDEAAAQRASADMAITTRIRSALLADDSLSFEAKNVKILTRNGKVTLRGAVSNARERGAVEGIARDVAGEGNVENQL